MGYIVAIILIVSAILIDGFKMYGLIAGYNTASKAEKKKIDVKALARLMRNVFFFLAGALVLLELFSERLGIEEHMSVIQAITIVTGVAYLIIVGNGRRYRN